MYLINESFNKVKKEYLRFLEKQKISKKLMNKNIKNLKKTYIPIAIWINNKYEKKSKPLLIGLSASQGSGKTTVAAILKLILKTFFKRKIFVISIDDFYKTLSDRKKMASQNHPLFKTRGVPGTHDVNLIKSFFQSVKKKNFRKINLPKFNKSIDDRFKKNNWHKVKKKPEIVIFEGWCVGAKAESNSTLKKPINLLEKEEDENLIWRKFVNKKLKTDYKNIFSMIDYYIFMKVPNFKMVFKWRLLQEIKLKNKNSYKKKIMTPAKIKRFVMFYQRITLQMIKDLGKSASIVMFLNKNHGIKKLLIR